MKVLAVDTATNSCSVAVVEGQQLLAELTLVSGETHSRHLVRLIDTLMQTAGLSLDRIEGFAVARGPGSFTGLRIGISTVKGLAVGGDRPAVGVSTLESLAWQIGPTDHLICPMIDARRKEIYAAVYRWEADRLSAVCGERAAPCESVLETIDGSCIFIGSGAEVYQRQIIDKMGHRALFVPTGLHSIRAAAIGMLGARRLSSGDSDDIERLVPTYLRKSDAEMALADEKPDSV